MMREPFYLTAVDPGGITGIITMRIEKDDFTVERQLADPYDPLNGRTPARTLQKWSRDFSGLPQVLVYEDFHLRPQGFLPDPIALNVIGGLETWLAGVLQGSRRIPCVANRSKASLSRLADLGGGTGCPYVKIVPREPVQGKNMATDMVLDRLGLLAYGPLVKDINDAFRHAVSWLTERKYRPVCDQAWPKRKKTSVETSEETSLKEVSG
ncbi:hypothetical protein ABT282_07765 [Streptomyces sp. NPDC000927]|uniref:hypothetical protein n=1 Tax=Streptomyces sp. NPDC000927 TaxID=3154371 RepID=UPI0033266E3B